jgi:hypothetical protein
MKPEIVKIERISLADITITIHADPSLVDQLCASLFHSTLSELGAKDAAVPSAPASSPGCPEDQ